MKKFLRLILVFALAAVLVFAVSALATEPEHGGEGDPLVTLSYLEQVFKGYITDLLHEDLEERTRSLQADLEERIDALEEASREARVESASTFHLLEMQDGQVLTGQRGVELLLRVGSAEVKAANSPGLVDTTTGGSLDNGGSLEKNHLYMITIPDNGIRAAGRVLILVRGDYSVN